MISMAAATLSAQDTRRNATSGQATASLTSPPFANGAALERYTPFMYAISSAPLASQFRHINKLKTIKILDLATRGVTFRALKGGTNRSIMASPIKRHSPSFSIYFSAPSFAGNPLHLARSLVNEHYMRIRPLVDPKPPHAEFSWSILRRARSLNRGLHYATETSIGVNVLYTIIPAKSFISRRAVDRNRVRRRIVTALKKVLPRVLSPLIFTDMVIVPKPTALLTPMPILCAELAAAISDVLSNEVYAVGALIPNAARRFEESVKIGPDTPQTDGTSGDGEGKQFTTQAASKLSPPSRPFGGADQTALADELWYGRRTGGGYRAPLVTPCGIGARIKTKPGPPKDGSNVAQITGELNFASARFLPGSAARMKPRPAFYVHPLYTNSILSPGRLFDSVSTSPLANGNRNQHFSITGEHDPLAALRARLAELMYAPLPEHLQQRLQQVRSERAAQRAQAHTMPERLSQVEASRLWRRNQRRAMRERLRRRSRFLSVLGAKRLGDFPTQPNMRELISAFNQVVPKGTLPRQPDDESMTAPRRFNLIEQLINGPWSRPERGTPQILRVPHCPFMALPPWLSNQPGKKATPVPVPWTMPNVEHAFRVSLQSGFEQTKDDVPLTLYPGSFHTWATVQPGTTLESPATRPWSVLSPMHPLVVLGCVPGASAVASSARIWSNLQIPKFERDVYERCEPRLRAVLDMPDPTALPVNAKLLPLPRCIPPKGAVPVAFIPAQFASGVPTFEAIRQAAVSKPPPYRSPPALAQDITTMSSEDAKYLFENYVDRQLALPGSLNIPFLPTASMQTPQQDPTDPNNASSPYAALGNLHAGATAQEYALILYLCALFEAETGAVRRSRQKASADGLMNDHKLDPNFVRNSDTKQERGPYPANFTMLFSIHSALEQIYTAMHCDEHISTIVSANLTHRSDRAPAFRSLMQVVGAGGAHGGVTGQGGLRRTVIHRTTGVAFHVTREVYELVRLQDKRRKKALVSTATPQSLCSHPTISSLLRPVHPSELAPLRRLNHKPSLFPEDDGKDRVAVDASISAFGTTSMSHPVHVPRPLRQLIKLLIDLNQLNLLHEIIPRFRELCLHPFGRS